MSRLFATSHRDVYNLFKAWGWEDGPERADGHKRMVWPETQQIVHIMPPDRAGTGELGNSLAIKEATKIMRLASIDEFFDGWEKRQQERREARMARASKEYHEAMERVMQQAAEANQTEEKQMARTTENQVIGIIGRMVEILEEMHDVPLKVDEITDEYLRRFGDHGLGRDDLHRRIRQNLTNMKAYKPQLTSPSRGVWIWSNERNVPDGKVVGTVPVKPAESKVVTNGSTPELLSKVATLDGGVTLFQGDDGALYVVGSLRKIDIT